MRMRLNMQKLIEPPHKFRIWTSGVLLSLNVSFPLVKQPLLIFREKEPSITSSKRTSFFFCLPPQGIHNRQFVFLFSLSPSEICFPLVTCIIKQTRALGKYLGGGYQGNDFVWRDCWRANFVLCYHRIIPFAGTLQSKKCKKGTNNFWVENIYHQIKIISYRFHL